MSRNRNRYQMSDTEVLPWVYRAQQGDAYAMEHLIRDYHGFVRLKARSYFLVGGEHQDLIQEGRLGLYKAIRDFRPDRDSGFRNFAELCITRQIITAIKMATRNKHSPLNGCISFAAPLAPSETFSHEEMLEETLPGLSIHDPLNRLIASEGLRSLVACLSTTLTDLESRVLSLYLDDLSYAEMAARLGVTTKTIDNALQRLRRKVTTYLESQAVAA